MTDLPVHFSPDPAQTAALRGALPNAPLAMPAQPLEPALPAWVDRIALSLRLRRLPLSRGA
jgi:hypothetical protein